MSNVFTTLSKVAGAEVSFTNGTSAPASYFQGIPLEEDGSVSGDTAGALVNNSQGLPITVNGRVATQAAAVSFIFGGVGFTAGGRLAV